MSTSYDVLLEPNSEITRAVKDVAFGSVAGMVSKVFEHPFDLTKVRLQSQVLDSMARFDGPIDCLSKTWKNEGLKGLYRGLPAPIVGAMAENASLFLSYSELQAFVRWMTAQSISSPLSLSHLAIAGAGAGAITSFVLTPIELVKCKMQVQMLLPPSLALSSSLAAPAKLPGPISVLSTIIGTTGFRGLWLGHTGTLIRETGGGAAWFAAKEFVASLLISFRIPSSMKGKAKEIHLKPWESALSGACAGIAYNVVLFPADTIKSAIQTEEELRPRTPGIPRPTFAGMARDMWKKQGFKGLYAGCGITVARSVPSSAIIFLIYDGLRRRYG